jgi:hypothetical protein
VAVVPAGDNLDEVCAQLEALCGRIRAQGRSARGDASPCTSTSAS